jgi:hypothetical protein
MKDGYINDCKKCRDAYDKNRVATWGSEKHRAVQKKYRLKLRKECLNAYGGKCACCGETTDEFLEVDHVAGGGNKHRKSTGTSIYQIAKNEAYPEKYRLLCANCNHALGMKGYCPHRR